MSDMFKVSKVFMQKDVVVKFKVCQCNQRVGGFPSPGFQFCTFQFFGYGKNKIVHRGKTPNLHYSKNDTPGRKDEH